MKRFFPIFSGICILILLLTIISGVLYLRAVNRKYTRQFAPSQGAVPNPLMGYAPCAWYKTVSQDVNLLYMDITWRELEPEEGVYDWESIEEENQLDRWRKEGKHIVLRFVCDRPDDEPHRDIPDWLYEKTAGAGTAYDISYGCGFSPDYNDPQFRQYHHRAVAALGEKYGQDGFISFVELGSLGHWGEWHVRYSDGIRRLPLADVREEYVKTWVDAFPNAQILLRRPFAEGASYGLGLYNDMAGHPESTREWLDWIAHGGDYSQTGETGAIVPMPERWKTAPMGGELTSSLEMEQMLVDNLPQTISLIRDSHTTFLGPKIAEKEYPEGYEKLLSNMGYRLWISKASLRLNPISGAGLHLTWENDGVAPFYEDWPVLLYVMDTNYRLLQTIPVNMDLRKILPGEQVISTTVLSSVTRETQLENLVLAIGIVDPMTGKNAVTFAMKNVKQKNGKLFLFAK